MIEDETVSTALEYAHRGRALPSDIRWQLTDEQWPMVLAAYESYIVTLFRVSDADLIGSIGKVCDNVLAKSKESE